MNKKEKKKLLVLGAGPLQVPGIVKAKKMGLIVGVVDFDDKAEGIQYADYFYNVSTNDITRVLEVAESFRPDGVVTFATDMPMRSVAAVGELLGLPTITPKVAFRATDKIEMIKCFNKHKVPHPWFLEINQESDLDKINYNDKFPLIMKPSDSSGSRGVVFVPSVNELKRAYKYSVLSSKSGNVLLEEFMRGREVSVEVLISQGNSYVIAITDKLTTGIPHFVEMGHSQPSSMSNELQREIKNIAVKAVEALGIDNSAAHVELMVTGSKVRVIEVGARGGGDFITSHLTRLSTGVDFLESSIKIALANKLSGFEIKTNSSIIRYIKSPNKGVVKKMNMSEKIRKNKNVVEVFFFKKVGDKVNEIESSSDRLGCVITKGETLEDAMLAYEYAIQNITIQIL